MDDTSVFKALENGLRHEEIPTQTLEELRAKGLVEDRGSLGRVWFLTAKGRRKLGVAA